MAQQKWDDLSPRVRRLIVAAGAFEAVLKVAALTDLARRSPLQVRGAKPRWATAIVLLNSVGAAPIAYFIWGRRRS